MSDYNRFNYWIILYLIKLQVQNLRRGACWESTFAGVIGSQWKHPWLAPSGNIRDWLPVFRQIHPSRDGLSRKL